jgi:AraC-like DNA-binding protein
VARGYITGILSGLVRKGHDPAPLLAEAGIDLSDPECRVPAERYAALYNRIAQRYDDEGCALFSRPLPYGVFEFLCRALIGAPTLEEALRRACRFYRVVLPDFSIACKRETPYAQLSISERIPVGQGRDDPLRIFAFELILRVLYAVASWLVGRRLAFEAVDFPYAPPAHADDYARIYTGKTRFAAKTLIAHFHADFLDFPIRRDEAALTRFLDDSPGKILLRYRRDQEMSVYVRDLLRGRLSENPSLRDIAACLCLSPRTLSRRLEGEETSFRDIKTALRHELACHALIKTSKSIARIAMDLGYGDTSAFYRTFIACSGISPRQFRGRLLKTGNRGTSISGDG